MLYESISERGPVAYPLGLFEEVQGPGGTWKMSTSYPFVVLMLEINNIYSCSQYSLRTTNLRHTIVSYNTVS